MFKWDKSDFSAVDTGNEEKLEKVEEICRKSKNLTISTKIL